MVMAVLLGETGCTEYQIMSVLGYSDPETSAIYTRAAKRPGMAAEAIASIEGLKFD